jgi:4-amino-4-deoxychorismate lyase
MDQVFTFVSGEAAPAPGVDDRGFNYGHGVFETMRLYRGSIPLWQWHRRRLIEGAATLGITVAPDFIERQLAEILAVVPPDGLIKLVATAGGGRRGYRFSGTSVPTTVFSWQPEPAPAPPAALQVCRHRLPANPALAGVKHLNRLDQVLAAMELGDDMEGLLLDSGGRVIEGLSHNLFARIDGRWVTPKLDAAGVAGVMRRYLMEHVFPTTGRGVGEAHLSLGPLLSAEELLLCNAVTGIRPVASLGHDWQRVEWPETEQLIKTLADLQPCFAV